MSPGGRPEWLQSQDARASRPSFDIHSVYRGRTRRIARRWPRVTLAALAIFGIGWVTVRAIQAAVTGT